MDQVPVKHLRPRGAALALILATERLIAEHGSAIVSLRQITEAAGVANSSAVNYHFGSRETLLLAVFQYRMGDINRRRHAYVDQLVATDHSLDSRSLVGALIHPLSEQLVPRPEGNYSIRFLERTTREGVRHIMSEIRPLMTAWMELDGLLRRTLAYLPAPVIDFRIRLMREQAVSALASIEAMLEHEEIARADLELHVEMVIDASLALLSGPISTKVLGLLSDAGSQDKDAAAAA
ncbi:MAG TPA: helix-turn-helix domain-containing protein [Allosphingosinicella sp.]|nr:helix-turn-helix domain-containing protein [Allosphingosinicella sp.]